MAQIRPLGEGFQAECHDLPVAVHSPTLQGAVSEVRERLRRYLADGQGVNLLQGKPPLILFSLQFAPEGSGARHQ